MARDARVLPSLSQPRLLLGGDATATVTIERKEHIVRPTASASASVASIRNGARGARFSPQAPSLLAFPLPHPQ